MNFPVRIAHRGYSKKFPENTISAFKGALNAGAEMIEFDVALTGDKKIVVIHDETVDRTTNGKGNVSDLTLDELKRFDAGSWFDPSFAGEKIPELEEVLDLIGKKAAMNIEIKPLEGSENNQESINNSIEFEVVNLLRKKECGFVLISSSNPTVLKNISKLDDALPIALITESGADAETISLCKELNVYSWHPNFKNVTPEQVKIIRDMGIHVFPYTVNTENDYKNLLKMKVHGVFTDTLLE